MQLIPRNPKAIWIASAFLGAVGAILIWLMSPASARDGWQPPADEFVSGFLKDGRTLVTVPRSASGNRIVGTPETGPIRLRDIDTGEVTGSLFGPDDVFDRVLVDSDHDLLQIQRKGDGANNFALDLVEARGGKQVASFTCHVPQNNIWWIVSPGGNGTAFVTFQGDQPKVEWCDIATGRRLHSFPDCREPIGISPDGKRLAASVDGGMVVFDLNTGLEVARLSAPQRWPKSFSPDGQLLLDDQCDVWDLAKRGRRFGVSGIYYNSSLFSRDGRDLMVVGKSKSDCWLAFHDLTDGHEILERRVRLVSGNNPSLHLGEATPDGRFLLATGTPQSPKPSLLHIWLAKIPGLSRLARPEPVDAYLVIEASTGRILARGASDAWSCTPDGRFIVTRSRQEVYQVWDLPHRRSWRSIAPSIASWLLLLGLCTWLVTLQSHRLAGKS
ncbi:WD40 repeat domain-containing protein [Tundrisphaera lichenicola]|uniref:WD40 repeat domain-containing protein n=1 Tax=Tundrisphaera lichenicola TaxID=2029860 RepID=UPI003EBFA1D4